MNDDMVTTSFGSWPSFKYCLREAEGNREAAWKAYRGGQPDFVSQLPEEVILFIFSFLPPRDLVSAAATSSLLYRIGTDPLLWRRKARESTHPDAALSIHLVEAGGGRSPYTYPPNFWVWDAPKPPKAGKKGKKKKEGVPRTSKEIAQSRAPYVAFLKTVVEGVVPCELCGSAKGKPVIRNELEWAGLRMCSSCSRSLNTPKEMDPESVLVLCGVRALESGQTKGKEVREIALARAGTFLRATADARATPRVVRAVAQGREEMLATRVNKRHSRRSKAGGFINGFDPSVSESRFSLALQYLREMHGKLPAWSADVTESPQDLYIVGDPANGGGATHRPDPLSLFTKVDDAVPDEDLVVVHPKLRSAFEEVSRGGPPVTVRRVYDTLMSDRYSLIYPSVKTALAAMLEGGEEEAAAALGSRLVQPFSLINRCLDSWWVDQAKIEAGAASVAKRWARVQDGWDRVKDKVGEEDKSLALGTNMFEQFVRSNREYNFVNRVVAEVEKIKAKAAEDAQRWQRAHFDEAWGVNSAMTEEERRDALAAALDAMPDVVRTMLPDPSKVVESFARSSSPYDIGHLAAFHLVLARVKESGFKIGHELDRAKKYVLAIKHMRDIDGEPCTWEQAGEESARRIIARLRGELAYAEYRDSDGDMCTRCGNHEMCFGTLCHKCGWNEDLPSAARTREDFVPSDHDLGSDWKHCLPTRRYELP